MSDSRDLKEEKKKRNRKKLKSSGSKSIEEEEDDLAQICLTEEKYVLEEKQELDLFLETTPGDLASSTADDLNTPSNAMDSTETGSQDDESDVTTPNVASQSEITIAFLEPTNNPADTSTIIASGENTSLISGVPIDQSKKAIELQKD